jgi:uncharacterized protein (TIGR02453 family)
MIEKQTLQFLTALAKNNNKPWFDANKTAYLAAKENMLATTQQIINGLNKIDDTIAASALEPKACVSRINRDVRFSKNKSPYKNNFFAMLKQGGKKSSYAEYYVQIEPGKSFIGAGHYMPMPLELQKIRQEIDYNLPAFKKIIDNKTFLKHYPKGLQAPESLVRPPKGFELDNPALPYLKMKGYFVVVDLTDAQVMDKAFVKNALKSLEVAKPLVDFLNSGLR